MDSFTTEGIVNAKINNLVLRLRTIKEELDELHSDWLNPIKSNAQTCSDVPEWLFEKEGDLFREFDAAVRDLWEYCPPEYTLIKERDND